MTGLLDMVVGFYHVCGRYIGFSIFFQWSVLASLAL